MSPKQDNLLCKEIQWPWLRLVCLHYISVSYLSQSDHLMEENILSNCFKWFAVHQLKHSLLVGSNTINCLVLILKLFGKARWSFSLFFQKIFKSETFKTSRVTLRQQESCRYSPKPHENMPEDDSSNYNGPAACFNWFTVAWFCNVTLNALKASDMRILKFTYCFKWLNMHQQRYEEHQTTLMPVLRPCYDFGTPIEDPAAKPVFLSAPVWRDLKRIKS